LIIELRLHQLEPCGVSTTSDDEDPGKVRRVRKVAAPPPTEGDQSKGSGREDWDRRREDPGDFDGDEAEMYRFVTVPSIEEGGAPGRSRSPMRQQVEELFNDFKASVAEDSESFYQFMLWAAADEAIVFEDLLIATKSVYSIMDEPMPCSKQVWNELVDMANLMEVSTVADSELEYALEVFSKAFDLYRAELQRLDEERDEAERLSSQRITEEIIAEDEEHLYREEEEMALETAEAPEPEVDLATERWQKLVEDTRYQINSTKAEFDELIEELTPSKEEREQALSRLRVLEKDANRRHSRLERYQSGRVSEAKAEEISNLERELIGIEDEQADWNSRLTIAQERIDQRIGLCAQKRGELVHIKDEVNSLLGSLTPQDRAVVNEALAGELHDLDEILEEVDGWLAQITSDTGDGAGITDILDGAAPVPGEARKRADSIAGELVEREGGELELPEEPPVVFMDAEVRRMLRELPIERPPEEELLLRIDSLQQELLARENTIMEMEHTIEKLMEDKEGSTTAVELERNKYKLELNKIQEELAEKQGLLEQYLDVIRNLETQMETKDRELRETLALNRRKTDELRQKETELESLERELLERQEEFRQEKQELMDRESRLNAQVSERETQEREIAKKDLTLELRNEQIRKKMDRLTAKELELQRITSHQKEMEEMLTLKERELQNLKTELDVREEDLRARDASLEERTTELKKLQSEVSKMEHRVRGRDETLRRREAHQEEEDARIRHLEASIAQQEVQLRDREEEMALREAKVDSTVATIESQRERVETERQKASTMMQEAERLRIAQEHRHDELIRREDSLSVREDTLRERERAMQLREERLDLERRDLDTIKQEYQDQELKWSAREKNLLEQLETFNSEKEELMEDWRASKTRIRELEREKADLTARLIAAESSLMNKDGEILSIARDLEMAQGRGEGAVIELDKGTKTSLRRIIEDVERQQVSLHDLEVRTKKVEGRERELAELEEMVAKEREKVRELLAEQERGRLDLQEALDQLQERTEYIDKLESSVKEREASLVAREKELAARETSVRSRERDMERLTTAELAEARAEDREEELASLQRNLEGRNLELEEREEELERTHARLREQEVELERQKAELLIAREELVRAGAHPESVPEVPEVLTSPPPHELATGRARSGLAMRAALMVAQSRRDEEEEDGERKVLARLKCKGCSTVIPIYTEERPLEIVCPYCGKHGILK